MAGMLDPQTEWERLIAARAQPEADQNILAPREHGAYARYLTSQNPLMALPLLYMIPGYQGAKALGMLGGRSAPSLDQAAQAYRGMWQGLGDWWRR